MKKPRLLARGVATIAVFVVMAIAIIGAVALAAMPSLWSGRGSANTGFDPLFANQTCAPTRSGPPPVLAHLV